MHPPTHTGRSYLPAWLYPRGGHGTRLAYGMAGYREIPSAAKKKLRAPRPSGNRPPTWRIISRERLDAQRHSLARPRPPSPPPPAHLPILPARPLFAMASSRHTRRILFAAWPEGLPDASRDFASDEVELPPLEEGQALIKTLFLSVDPYMRGRMRNVKSYAPPFAIGQPLYGGGVGRVIESRTDDYKVGSLVSGMLTWQDLVVWSPALGPLHTLPAGTPSSRRHPLAAERPWADDPT